MRQTRKIREEDLREAWAQTKRDMGMIISEEGVGWMSPASLCHLGNLQAKAEWIRRMEDEYGDEPEK